MRYLHQRNACAMVLKRLLLYGGIAAVLAGAYGLYMFYKPVPGVDQMKTEAHMTSMELAGAFENDEASASDEYIGKVLEVTGVVTEVMPGDSSGVIVVLASDGFIQVLAGMSPEVEAPNNLSGSEVTVKGICTGATMLDVVLSRCIFLTPKDLSE